MEKYNYLIKKYTELELVRLEDEVVIHTGKNDMGDKFYFDPHIYPDTGNIPFCSVCSMQYDEYIKNNTKEIKWLHLSCGCLWSEYFMNKIKTIDPKINFIR